MKRKSLNTVSLFLKNCISFDSLRIGFLDCVTEIVHVHLATCSGDIVLFERPEGIWGPVSGSVEDGETYIGTATRELKEETGIKIDCNQIMVTEHTFNGISPRGKNIFGVTCFAVLSMKSTSFRFNEELINFGIFSPRTALTILAQKGFSEAKAGLLSILGL